MLRVLDRKEVIPITVRSLSRVPGEVPSVRIAQMMKRAWFRRWWAGLKER